VLAGGRRGVWFKAEIHPRTWRQVRGQLSQRGKLQDRSKVVRAVYAVYCEEAEAVKVGAF
jgi:hypothetical protein